eukprot:960851-Rhodomonas_salina.1
MAPLRSLMPLWEVVWNTPVKRWCRRPVLPRRCASSAAPGSRASSSVRRALACHCPDTTAPLPDTSPASSFTCPTPRSAPARGPAARSRAGADEDEGEDVEEEEVPGAVLLVLDALRQDDHHLQHPHLRCPPHTTRHHTAVPMRNHHVAARAGGAGGRRGSGSRGWDRRCRGACPGRGRAPCACSPAASLPSPPDTRSPASSCQHTHTRSARHPSAPHTAPTAAAAHRMRFSASSSTVASASVRSSPSCISGSESHFMIVCAVSASVTRITARQCRNWALSHQKDGLVGCKLLLHHDETVKHRH